MHELATIVLASVLSSVLGAGAIAAVFRHAAVNYLRDTFATRDDLAALSRERKESVKHMGERIGELERGRQEDRRIADEAYLSAELTQRAQVEQAQRMTEEVIKPLRQMASDMADVRTMFARYMAHTETHEKTLERLEARIDRVELRNPN